MNSPLKQYIPSSEPKAKGTFHSSHYCLFLKIWATHHYMDFASIFNVWATFRFIRGPIQQKFCVAYRRGLSVLLRYL